MEESGVQRRAPTVFTGRYVAWQRVRERGRVEREKC
jgi:hypothetical protein